MYLICIFNELPCLMSESRAAEKPGGAFQWCSASISQINASPIATFFLSFTWRLAALADPLLVQLMISNNRTVTAVQAELFTKKPWPISDASKRIIEENYRRESLKRIAEKNL